MEIMPLPIKLSEYLVQEMSWSFDWTVPTTGSGDLTFYGTFNASNSNITNSGDRIYTTSLAVNEAIITSLNETINSSKIRLFPNPTNSYFQILPKEGLNQVEIYNIAGKKMTEYQILKDKINIKNLPQGIYFIRLKNSSFIAKLIKN